MQHMKNRVPTAFTLEDVRRNIDAIDDEILELLVKRFRLVDDVKGAKARSGPVVGSPLRPAREASVLRRLIAQGQGTGLRPQLLVRLWPAIFCEASLRQQSMQIHVSNSLNRSPASLAVLRDYFPTMPIVVANDENAALKQVRARECDICVVETGGAWLRPILEGDGGSLQVVSALPFLSWTEMPQLLVIGRVATEATSDDESLLALQENATLDSSVVPRWQVRVSGSRVLALAGYLAADNLQPGVRLLGRYPRPLMMQSK